MTTVPFFSRRGSSSGPKANVRRRCPSDGSFVVSWRSDEANCGHFRARFVTGAEHAQQHQTCHRATFRSNPTSLFGYGTRLNQQAPYSCSHMSQNSTGGIRIFGGAIQHAALFIYRVDVQTHKRCLGNNHSLLNFMTATRSEMFPTVIHHLFFLTFWTFNIREKKASDHGARASTAACLSLK